MKKITVIIVLFAIMFSPLISNADDRYKQQLQDIEDLYNSGKISKEQYTKMQQNLIEMVKKPESPQPSAKEVYLDAYKDGIITQSQCYNIIKIYNDYPVEKANLEAANFITKEGKEEAVGVWFELKMAEFKKAKQARVNSSDYNVDSAQQKQKPRETEADIKKYLNNASNDELMAVYYRGKYLVDSNPLLFQKMQSGVDISSLTEQEIYDAIEIAKAEMAREIYNRRVAKSNMFNALGRGLATAGNIFLQNAQQMQQQSQMAIPKTQSYPSGRSYTVQKIGDFDYVSGSGGYSGTGQKIGDFYYYRDNE